MGGEEDLEVRCVPGCCNNLLQNDEGGGVGCSSNMKVLCDGNDTVTVERPAMNLDW